MIDPTEQRVRHLYRNMPGAPPVPVDEEGHALWGEVEHTEHYWFCRTVVETMIEIAAVHRKLR